MLCYVVCAELLGGAMCISAALSSCAVASCTLQYSLSPFIRHVHPFLSPSPSRGFPWLQGTLIHLLWALPPALILADLQWKSQQDPTEPLFKLASQVPWGGGGAGHP